MAQELRLGSGLDLSSALDLSSWAPAQLVGSGLAHGLDLNSEAHLTQAQR